MLYTIGLHTLYVYVCTCMMSVSDHPACVSSLCGACDGRFDVCMRCCERSGLLGLWGCGPVSSPVIVPVRCLRAVKKVESSLHATQTNLAKSSGGARSVTSGLLDDQEGRAFLAGDLMGVEIVRGTRRRSRTSLCFPIPNGNVALGISETQLLRVGSGAPRRTRLSAPCPASPPW